METKELIEKIFKLNNKYRKDGIMGPFYRSWIERSLKEGRTIHIEGKDNFGFASFRVLKKNPVINLQKLAVEESGCGLGSKLLYQVKNLANDDNRKVQARVAKKNDKSIDFYKKNGFVFIGDENKEHTYLLEFTGKNVVLDNFKDSIGTPVDNNLLVDDSSLNIDMHVNEAAKIQKKGVLERNCRLRNVNKKQKDSARWSVDYIPEWKDIPLTVNYINTLDMSEREEVAKYLFSFYRERGFPYPQYSDEELKKDFKNLCKFDSSKVVNGDEISSGSTTGNRIFRTFNRHFWHTIEHKKSKKAFDVFNDDELLLKVIRNRLGITFYYRGVPYPFTISGNMIRQGMRSMRMIPHITNFRPTIAKYFYEKYTEDNDIIYDFSHGWSQRMVAAAACKKSLTYVSVDPWEEQINTGDNIVDFFEFDDDKFDLNVGKSEEFCPDRYAGKVSLALSSPPYYDKEQYVDDESQAYHGREYDDFINDYWRRTCRNIYKLLKDDGRFVFNVFGKYKKYDIGNDMLIIARNVGFEVDRKMYMKISKSHLSRKVGTDNVSKKEFIFVMKKAKQC